MARHFKKLNSNELSVLLALKSGATELSAYQQGYPHVKNYKPETVRLQAIQFFQKPKIKYHMARKLPTEQERALRHPEGLATSYRPRYINRCIDYFNRPAMELVQHTDKDTGEVTTEEVVNKLPTRSGFACELGIPKATISGWSRITNEDGSLRYPEFAAAFKMGRDYTECILIENTLRGEYNPTFAKFVAQNLLDWTDKREVTTEDNSRPQVIINLDMTKEKAAEVYLEMMKPRLDKK